MVFKIDPKVKEIAERLPANAKYTSADIQNEVKMGLQSILETKIANEVKKAETFAVMMDGSNDKNWNEIEEIVDRFLNADGKIEEHAIDVVETQDRTSQGLLDLLVSSMEF